jgi:uncharacterized membrane protein
VLAAVVVARGESGLEPVIPRDGACAGRLAKRWDNGGVSTVNPDDSIDNEQQVAPAAEVVASEQVDALVRRSPRYLRFLLVGAVAGIIVALILTVAFPENDQFSVGQVFGFLILLFGVIGMTIGAVVALVLDRMLAKRARSATAEHTITRSAE